MVTERNECGKETTSPTWLCPHCGHEYTAVCSSEIVDASQNVPISKEEKDKRENMVAFAQFLLVFVALGAFLCFVLYSFPK